MVKTIQMYEANDGSTHRSQMDAISADLVHMFRQCGGIINEASAEQLVNKLKSDGEYRDEMIATLQLLPSNHKDACNV